MAPFFNMFIAQIEERQDITHYMQVEIQPKAQSETEAINPQSNYSKCFDDDGRLKRTGELLYYIIPKFLECWVFRDSSFSYIFSLCTSMYFTEI